MSSEKQNVASVLPEYALDNLGISFQVILVDSAQRIQGEMGSETYIPDYQGLIKQIALTRAAHPLKLKGGDIRFLRKTLGLKAKDLAEKLDLTPEHLSRCESGDKILSPNSEKVLRSLVILEAVYVLQKAAEDCPGDLSGLSEKITKLLVRLKDIISGMKLSAVHAVDEELVIQFSRVPQRSAGEPANDHSSGPPPEWEGLDEAA